VEQPQGNPLGTGFLIGPDLLLTNQHVLETKACLADAIARFGYAVDSSGVASEGHVIPIEPGFYEASPAEQLDYALVRLKAAPLQALRGDGKGLNQPVNELLRQGKHRGYLVLAARELRKEERINIIQHPGGDPLKVVLTQNRIALDMTANRIQYVADTMNGSSGSPVLNQHWEVVALHHSGQPYPPDGLVQTLKRAWKGKFRINEGIPMKAILKEFETRDLLRLLPREK
jgi:V8-like Glu-specific endopeptidase